MTKKKAAVYCAGNNFVQYYNRIMKAYDICVLIDSAPERWGSTVMGHKVISPDEVIINGMDLVFIASDRADIVESITIKINELWPGKLVESIRTSLISAKSFDELHEKCVWTDKLGNRFENVGGDRIGKLDISIHGCDNRIVIEKGVMVRDNLTVLIFGDNNTLTIGEGTSIIDAVLDVGEGGTITVGKDCMISTGVEFFQYEFHPIFDCDTGKRINQSENIVIGDHVWIGRNASLMGGFAIGNNGIVGAGSVSSSQFWNSVCIGGNPARIIRENVTWGRETLGLYEINNIDDLRI